MNYVQATTFFPLLHHCFWLSLQMLIDCKHEQLAARLIFGTGPRDSRNPVSKELGWLSLENQRCMHKCTMVFKCRNGLAPPYLIDSFNVNTFNHSYRTRISSKLRIPIARTEYYHRSFLISGCNAWNNLPDYTQTSVLNSICRSIF